ncbi:MAG: hypothetical protein GY809_00845 [Planctomycetes bacterium]|nr:hypothetical protein [Planctomycetota bacterium]
MSWFAKGLSRPRQSPDRALYKGDVVLFYGTVSPHILQLNELGVRIVDAFRMEHDLRDTQGFFDRAHRKDRFIHGDPHRLVQRCITAGQYNRGAVTLEDCALIEFPSAHAPFKDDDNDGLYLTGGRRTLTDCLVGWALDDGTDAGSGASGSVEVTGCWFESCYHEAMAFSDDRAIQVTDTVTLNCGQGIECGFGAPDVTATRCLSTANLVGARFGDNDDWSYNGFLTVTDSLLLFNVRDIWGRPGTTEPTTSVRWTSDRICSVRPAACTWPMVSGIRRLIRINWIS